MLTDLRLTDAFRGRMIYVSNLKDTATSPVSGAIGYRRLVSERLGPEGE